jgi:hypothetical protein
MTIFTQRMSNSQAMHEAGIKTMQAIECRLIEIDVDMDKTILLFWNFGQDIGNPSLNDFDFRKVFHGLQDPFH